MDQAVAHGPGIGPAFSHLLRRDLRLGLLRPFEATTPLSFCLVVATMFAFGVGPDLGALGEVAAGVVWTAALLGMVIAMEGMFASDHDDGTLEQLLLSPAPLPALVTAKALARWAWTALPLVAASPLMGIMMGMPAQLLGVLALSLLLGTPTIFLVGSLGAAMLVGQRKGTALSALLALPLCVPVLIFGVGMVKLAADGQAIEGPVSLLGALLALSVTFVPIATSAVLRGNGG